MKYYKNDNFRLCISTQIFMLFDLYVVSYDTAQTPEQENTLQTNLKNRSIDIDDFSNTTGALKYSKIISDIGTSLTTAPYNLSYKNINKISINSGGVYVWEEDVSTKHMLLIQIKRFDKFNYIIPMMATLNHEQLIIRNHEINLELFFDFMDNTKTFAQMLTTFAGAKI